jgi:hypothetical protein
VGLGSRTLLFSLSLSLAAYGAACTDTSNLTGGEDLPTRDAGDTKPKDSGGGTGIDDDGGPITPGGRCDPAKPFDAPTLVTDFDPEAQTTKSAVLSTDELEVFYLRYTGMQAGVWDLRHARRATKDAAWGPASTDPMNPGPAGFLALTAAGRKLYFWNLNQNYRAGRASTSVNFGAPVTYSSPSGAPWSFIVDADDTVYYARYAEGGSERFIVRAPFDSNGYSGGTDVPNVHVAGYGDNRPVLNKSETVMYFGSNRPGGKGLDDVWVARRTTKQDEFGPGIHVRELATADPDYVTWVSDDDCIVYLDRASHIYIAKRPR